jgi:hypothetical protein
MVNSQGNGGPPEQRGLQRRRRLGSDLALVTEAIWTDVRHRAVTQRSARHRGL